MDEKKKRRKRPKREPTLEQVAMGPSGELGVVIPIQFHETSEDHEIAAMKDGETSYSVQLRSTLPDGYLVQSSYEPKKGAYDGPWIFLHRDVLLSRVEILGYL